jgi:flagellar basal-body rod modification protein FlgD
VLAANGDTSGDATALMPDRQVTAVSMDNGSLQLQLSRGGMTTTGAIKAILYHAFRITFRSTPWVFNKASRA